MDQKNNDIRPDVLNYDDIRQMVPKLDGHEKLVNWLLHFLQVDEVNAVHARSCDTPGPEFVRRMLIDDFKIKLRIDNEQELDHLPEGAFITVSNHPFGALDGITSSQPSVLEIIKRAKVPVIPIFFHGTNSWWFNILGHICWPARSLRLPAEVFRKRGKTIHVSIGEPVSVEDQARFASAEELGAYLREKTYDLRKRYHKIKK